MFMKFILFMFIFIFIIGIGIGIAAAAAAPGGGDVPPPGCCCCCWPRCRGHRVAADVDAVADGILFRLFVWLLLLLLQFVHVLMDCCFAYEDYLVGLCLLGPLLCFGVWLILLYRTRPIPILHELRGNFWILFYCTCTSFTRTRIKTPCHKNTIILITTTQQHNNTTTYHATKARTRSLSTQH